MKLNNFEQEINENQGYLSCDIQLSNTRIKDAKILELLNIEPSYFLYIEATTQLDNINFSANIKNYTRFTNTSLSSLESCKLAYNILRFLDLENSIVQPVIHPENIVLDINNIPYLFYRGLSDYLQPEQYIKSEILLQVKCLIFSLLDNRLSYENLYNGQLELAQDTEFKKKIFASTKKEELEALLLEAIEYEKDLELKTKVFVSKRNYSMYKTIALLFVIISIALGGVAAFSYVIERPKLQNYLQANDKYINKDYSGVIDSLISYPVDNLPKAQKQVLAIASINVLSLSNEQRKTVLNSISTSTNDATLNSWILLARGDYPQAIDNAIKANDLDLQAYSLIRYRDAILQDKKLSGSEIKKRVSELDKDIKEVQDKKNGVNQ